MLCCLCDYWWVLMISVISSSWCRDNPMPPLKTPCPSLWRSVTLHVTPCHLSFVTSHSIVMLRSIVRSIVTLCDVSPEVDVNPVSCLSLHPFLWHWQTMLSCATISIALWWWWCGSTLGKNIIFQKGWAHGRSLTLGIDRSTHLRNIVTKCSWFRILTILMGLGYPP